MIKLFGYIKLIASAIVILGMLVSTAISVNGSEETQIALISSLILLVITAVYSYYLVRTGIWNVKEKEYSINVMVIIGLLIHFLFAISLLIFSQYVTDSKEESTKLLLTTAPFCIAGIIIGVFDTKQLVRTWKAKRLA